MKVGLATASTEQLMFLLLQAADIYSKKMTADYSCLHDRKEAENYFGFAEKVLKRNLVSLLRQSPESVHF